LLKSNFVKKIKFDHLYVFAFESNNINIFARDNIEENYEIARLPVANPIANY